MYLLAKGFFSVTAATAIANLCLLMVGPTLDVPKYLIAALLFIMLP